MYLYRTLYRSGSSFFMFNLRIAKRVLHNIWPTATFTFMKNKQSSQKFFTLTQMLQPKNINTILKD